jgi:hypothetical protein
VRFEGGWVVWDRLRGRVADGIDHAAVLAQQMAAYDNAIPEAGDRDWFGGTSWSTNPPAGPF